jgi:hypothetical protein
MKPRKEVVRTSVDLPVDLHRRLKELAARKGCSSRKLIVDSIEDIVVRESPKRPVRRLDLRNHPLVSVGGGVINPTPEEIDELLFS